MTPPFKDYFSSQSSDYRISRPGYPEALFAELASECPGTSRAWDCACGSGQAATGMVQCFDQVVASDPSVDSCPPRKRRRSGPTPST